MERKGILQSIGSPGDLRGLTRQELVQLCEEIRAELIEVISKNGGHLASNLGMVELTVALHRRFNSPYDRLIFDVGHQCYIHKLLTGRQARFSTIRTEGGLSGFTRPQESEHDVFISGHASTSISAGYGLAAANQLRGIDDFVVAVIGDGALTGGLAYEALNNAGRQNSNLIVVLNDNKMSISKNVGAMARHLAVIRSRPNYYRFKSGVERFLLRIPGMGRSMRNGVLRLKRAIKNAVYNSTIFEDMGFAYLGPIDGHDLDALDNCLRTAREMRRPALVHVLTIKGKGYRFAELDPGQYHGISSMNVKTGECPPSKDSFSFQFGRMLSELAARDARVCAITAAMTEGCGLGEFRERFPSRFYDVGIAEGHAVTFASGLSKGGMRPFVCLYSTFLQRSYDQIIHDAAIQELPLTICVDRAGFVGEDGETHQGLFDAAFLGTIPGITVWSPSCYAELELLLHHCVDFPGVCVIRYPRGSQPKLPEGWQASLSPCSCYGTAGASCVLATYGRLFGAACEAADELLSRGVSARVVKVNRIRPLPEEVFSALKGARQIFFFEEGIRAGGVGETLFAALAERGMQLALHLTAVDCEFVPQATVASCLHRYGLDREGMVNTVLDFVSTQQHREE